MSAPCGFSYSTPSAFDYRWYAGIHCDKRRKLGTWDSVVTNTEQARVHKATSAPVRIYQSPPDLAYAVLTSDKTLYSKQEVLEIISMLSHMFDPKFEGECSYII